MKSRVTITLDQKVFRLAKEQARAKRTTLSGLIQSLLKSVNATAKEDLVTSMIGSCTLRNPVVGTDPLYLSLKSKYLK